jgi:hypothetical protein
MAVAAEIVGAMLVGDEEEKIRPPCHRSPHSSMTPHRFATSAGARISDAAMIR